MKDSFMTVSELDDTALTTALTGFADFYINLWKTNNLELITQFDQQHGYIQNINRELAANRYFTPDEALNASVSFNHVDYLHLLNEIGVRFHATGNPEYAWQNWYEQQFSLLATS